jgi:hypothetical protein
MCIVTPSMSSAAAAAAVFLAGCGLLVLALRWWRPAFPARAALGYVALTAAFFAAPLATGALQVPTDLAYEWLPFSELGIAPAAPHNFFQADTLLEQLPFHALVRQRLLAGEAPLWAHELGTGQPLLGNGQSAPFAPLHLMALPVAPLRALTVAGAWQILLGLLGAHALLLRLGAGPRGAALGAVSSGLSTYAVVWIYDTPGMAAAFVPGLLLGILLLRDGEPRAAAGLVACALALALSGHPETMAHAGLAAAALVAALLALDWRRGRGTRRPGPEPPGPEPPGRPGTLRFLGRLAAAAGISAALAAPALLPLVETIPQSVRGKALERSPENFQPPPFEARFLLPVFAPLALGSPPDGDYSLKWSFNEIASDYAGLLPLALALAGAIALRGRPLLLVLGGLGALLVALRLPPLFDLMLRLPVIGPGAHGRMRELWVLGVALAAGLALERVAGERLPRAVAAALILAAGIALALAPPPGSAPWPRAWWLATLAGAALALAALLAPRLRPAFPALAVAAAAADLFLLGVRYHPPVPARLDLAPPPTVAYMMRRQQAAAATPFRVSFEGFDLPSNLNALYGLWDPRGYDPMRPEDAARMVGWWLGHRRRFYQNIGDSLPELDQAAHDFLAVRLMETSHQRELPPPWRLVFEGKGGRVWENPRSLPLFFMPRSVVEAANLGEARRAAMRSDDFQEVAQVVAPEGGGSGGGAPAGGGPGGSPGSGPGGDSAATIPAAGGLGSPGAGEARRQAGQVRYARPRSNGFDLAVDSATGGIVASSVSHAAGWQASDESGRSLPVVEVDGGFLGVRVPPGSHAIRLRYRPRGWTAGLAALFATGLALLAAAWVGPAKGGEERRGETPA